MSARFLTFSVARSLGLVLTIGCGSGGSQGVNSNTMGTGGVGGVVETGNGGEAGVVADAGDTGAPMAGSGGTAGTGGSGGSDGGKGGTAKGGSSSAGKGGKSAAGAAGLASKPADDPPSPAHVVGNCDGLADVDKFEEVTPGGLDLSDNGITHVLADPLRGGTVYCATDKQGLFKSLDCGSTWTKINTGENGALLDTGTLWSVAIDTHNPDVIYAGALYGDDLSLFQSQDGGVNWQSLATKDSLIGQTVEYNYFQDLSIDVTDHNHIVTTFHAACKGDYAPSCLAESMDMGATWRLFKSPMSSWGEGAGPFVLGKTTFLISTFQNGMFYTEDSGANWAKVAPGSNRQMYKAKNGALYTGSDYGVNRSTDNGKTWIQVPSSPHASGTVGDGIRIFHSATKAPDDQQPYWTSSEDDGMTWTKMASPNMPNGGAYLAYDYDHFVLYSANTKYGMWRVRTRTKDSQPTN